MRCKHCGSKLSQVQDKKELVKEIVQFMKEEFGNVLRKIEQKS